MRNIQTLAFAMLGSVGLCLIAAGCAADRNQDVPPSAKLVAQGEKDVTYRAPEDGKIYVFDKNAQNVLYSSRVDKDQLLKVDAMHDKILLDDRTVVAQKIHDHDPINIFFEAEPRPTVIEARPASDRTIIHEREIRTEPRSDSTITVHPDKDKVTVEGTSDSKVTVEQPSADSKVTIERGAEQQR